VAKTSVIVPARNERNLVRTVDNLLTNATGDIEIIIILDGRTKFEIPAENARITIIPHSNPQGKSVSINQGAAIAKGKYLMFVDAHCSVCPGYDEILQADCDDNWVVIPRYYMLESKTLTLKNYRPLDYFYLAVSWSDPEPVIQSDGWMRRTLERQNGLSHIDETMSIPGSLTFMTAEHFHTRLGGLAAPAIGTDSTSDWLDVIMKTWLGGGRVMVNKNAWYGHMNAPPTRGYTVNQENIKRDYVQASRYWLENRWEGRQFDFDWIVDRFWPLPTAATKMRSEKYIWPEDWHDDYERMQWRKPV